MKPQTLQRQFRLWTAVLIVVPCMLIMAIYTVGQLEIARQKNLELMSHTVAFQKRLIDHWLEERAATVHEITEEAAFRNQELMNMNSILQRKQQADQNFDSLSFVNKDGIFEISTLSSGIRFPSAASRPYFVEAQAGRNFISDVVIGRNSGQPIINFSAPVYDNKGNFQGLVLGSVRTTTLESLTREQMIGQSGEIMLVNREGTMITEPRHVAELIAQGLVEGSARMKFKMTSDAYRNIRLGESGTASWVDYRGNKVFGAYINVPERGWTLICKINEAEVLMPIYKQLLLMAGVTGCLVLLILPLAALLTKRLKRPIDWLVKQSHLVAAEEYALVGKDRLPGKMPYELAVLCNTFVKMNSTIENTVNLLKNNEAKLANKIVEIQEMNATLEEEVGEREAAQAALRDLNAELENIVQQRTRELQEMNSTLEEEIWERQAAQEELKQKNEAIRRMAYMDLLTELPNRASLNDRLLIEMERVQQGNATGAVVFVDLDDLKMVNDGFGHNYGDALIKTAGKRIKELAGERAFVGRIGGDEFLVILPEFDRNYVANFAEQIIHEFNHDFEVLDIHFRVSASVGIAIYPDDGDGAEEIFKNADNAMYEAKKSGKNCWRFYHAAMQSDAYEKVLLVNQLRYAVERGELLLYYQPQVSAIDNSILGFEALLRWNNSELGSVSPARFIPLAEQSGLIQNIGNWVLHEACMFGRRLNDSGWTDIQIAVNVSPHQLCSEVFADNVKMTLAKAGIEPRQLELEVTENTLIASLEETTRQLVELRAMGVSLALDDFGTGYSSLTYLQALPVKTLKIDKTFIDKLLVNDDQKNIVKTIVDLAHSMNMIVVAEGVETEYQLDYLLNCRCDRIQGYIFSRPLPEDDVMQFLTQHAEQIRNIL